MLTFMTRAKPIFWIYLLLPIAACSAADGAKQANCETLVEETKATCLDMIRRGLDVSCNTYLGAVATAMKQASGDLFDTGDATTDQSSADSFCSTYVGKLRKDRDAHADSMQAADAAGPKCTALADRFESHCLANLGSEPLPSGCKGVARSFMMRSAARPSAQQQLCTIAGMQLPQ